MATTPKKRVALVPFQPTGRPPEPLNIQLAEGVTDADLVCSVIIVKFGYAGGGHYGWWATLQFQDARFAEHGCVEGNIHTRYAHHDLAASLDYVVDAAARCGIKYHADKHMEPHLYYDADGRTNEYPPPTDWRETIIAEAKRRGWKSYVEK